MAGVGANAACVFSHATAPTSLSAQVLSVGEWNVSTPAIANTPITATQFEQFIIGRIMNHDPLSITINWRAQDAIAVYGAAYKTRWLGRPGTILTLTYPFTDLTTTQGTLTGGGFIESFPVPAIEPNEAMRVTLSWRFEGSDITFTNEA